MQLHRLGGFALAAAMIMASPSAMYAQASTAGAKQDMKDSGHESKNAAKDFGSGVKKGTKKAWHGTKKGTKKAYHKVDGNPNTK